MCKSENDRPDEFNGISNVNFDDNLNIYNEQWNIMKIPKTMIIWHNLPKEELCSNEEGQF